MEGQISQIQEEWQINFISHLVRESRRIHSNRLIVVAILGQNYKFMMDLRRETIMLHRANTLLHFLGARGRNQPREEHWIHGASVLGESCTFLSHHWKSKHLQEVHVSVPQHMIGILMQSHSQVIAVKKYHPADGLEKPASQLN